MEKKAKMHCMECGHRHGFFEQMTSDLDLSKYEPGDVIECVCLGSCTAPATRHKIESVSEVKE